MYDPQTARKLALLKPAVVLISGAPQAEKLPGDSPGPTRRDGLVEDFWRHAGHEPELLPSDVCVSASPAQPDISADERTCLLLRVSSDADFTSAEMRLANWYGTSNLHLERVPGAVACGIRRCFIGWTACN